MVVMINSELSDKLIVFLLLMLITHAVDQTTDNRQQTGKLVEKL